MSPFQLMPTRDLCVCLSLEIGSLQVSIVKGKSYWRRAALNWVARVLAETREDRDPRESHGTAEAEMRGMHVPAPDAEAAGACQSRGEALGGAALTCERSSRWAVAAAAPAAPGADAPTQGWQEAALLLLT